MTAPEPRERGDGASRSLSGSGGDGRLVPPWLDAFRAAWWLPGPHFQSAYATLCRTKRIVDYRREVLVTPDDDDLVLDHIDGRAQSPHLILLHGLEASSLAPYVQALAARAHGLSWSVTAINFRTCALDLADPSRWLPNRRPRMYHSGDTADLDLVVRTLRERAPDRILLAGAFSLGANVLLKWLGEDPVRHVLDGAVTLSAPFDLAAGARHLMRGLGQIYFERFMTTMRPKAIDLVRRYPGLAGKVDIPGVKAARSFFEFDDAATAPIHGFASAAEYHASASSIASMARIRVPTLCINADDDPFLPVSVLHRARETAPPCVTVAITRGGGHVGWVEGRVPGRPHFWGEAQAIEWLRLVVDARMRDRAAQDLRTAQSHA